MDNVLAKEQIAFIKQAMADSRNIIVENGLIYITWGCLNILGTIATYIALSMAAYPAIYWVWGIDYGIAYFVSHTLLQNKWMIILALGWWAGMIAFFFMPQYSGPQ